MIKCLIFKAIKGRLVCRNITDIFISGCSAAGSAPALGAGCRGFESRHSDHIGMDFAPFRFFFKEKSVICAVIRPFRKRSYFAVSLPLPPFCNKQAASQSSTGSVPNAALYLFAHKKERTSNEVRPSFVPATTYSPGQLPAKYHQHCRA